MSVVKRLLSGGASILLGVVLVAVAAHVDHGLYAAANVAAAQRQAVRDLTAALPASTGRAARDRDRVRTALEAPWGRPAHSWQELVCDLQSRDVGWIPQTYEQTCRIRSVDLIPTRHTTGAGCERLPTLDDARRGVGAGSPDPLWAVEAALGPAAVVGGADPQAAGCPDGITAPARYRTSRLLTGTRPATLRGSPAWVVVEVDTDVSRTDLGCDPWALLFCTPPVDAPVLGALR